MAEGLKTSFDGKKKAACLQQTRDGCDVDRKGRKWANGGAVAGVLGSCDAKNNSKLGVEMKVDVWVGKLVVGNFATL